MSPQNQIPTENTLTLNVTHDVLDRLERTFTKISAFSPTRRMEKYLGFDVGLYFAKGIVFQYKRPTGTRNGKVKFSINEDQRHTLSTLFSRQEAFFALPNIRDPSNLPNGVSKTIFVDVKGVMIDTSIIYLPNRTPYNSLPTAHGKIRNGEYYPLSQAYIYTGNQLIRKIRNCDVGQMIVSEGKKTDKFREFEERVDKLYRLNKEWLFRKYADLVSEWREMEFGIDIGEEEIQKIVEEKVKNLKKVKDPSTHQIKRSEMLILEND